MGLCGSFRCGCGVTSTAATTGAINGDLPSILVSGSGEPGDPYDLQLNDAWAAEVAALLGGAGEGGAWTSWTPTLSQGASTNIAKTVTYSKYARYGRTIIWSFNIAATAAGTAGSAITLTLPVTASSTAYTGSGQYFDSGAQFYSVAFTPSSTTVTRMASHAANNSFGIAPAVTVASGDSIYGVLIYEAAS